MTSAETAVWNIVRARRLGWKFRRQEPMGPFIVDFVYVERRLVVEMDGDGHGGDFDRDRDAYLQRLGFRVLRFAIDDLRDREWVVDRIKEWADHMERR